MGKDTWERIWKNQSKSKTYFDRILWKLRHNTSKSYAKRIGRLMEGSAKPNILEIGCGSAVTFKYLLEEIPGCKLTGLDFSPAGLALAAKLNPGCKFVEGDARKMPFKSNSFDFVYSLGLIEHFTREDALKIIKEHCRAAKKGAIVMLVVPAKYSLLNVARIIAGKRWPWGFEDPFSSSELLGLMTAAGLKNVKIRRVKTIVLFAVGTKR